MMRTNKKRDKSKILKQVLRLTGYILAAGLLLSLIYKNYHQFRSSYAYLTDGYNWIIIATAAIFIFPWEIFGHIQIPKLLNIKALQVFFKDIFPKFNELLASIPHILIWVILYTVFAWSAYRIPYFFGDETFSVSFGRTISFILYPVLVFVFGVLLIRYMFSRLGGQKMIEKALSSKAIKEYPIGIIFGSSLVVLLTVIMFIYLAMGNRRETYRTLSPSSYQYSPAMMIRIDDIKLSSNQITGTVNLVRGYPAVKIGNQMINGSGNEPFTAPIWGDTYLYPFTIYTLNLYAFPQIYVAGKLTDAKNPDLEIYLSENSRLFDLVDDGELGGVRIQLTIYQKLLAVTIFVALWIFLLAIWATKDRNTIIELAVGIFASLITIRSFLIPADLNQPLLIDQIILMYVIILMVTLLLKLSRRPSN